jgi:general secretion pathway protein D
MDQADALLRWRELDAAEDLATVAAEQRVRYNQFEQGPEALLDQIAAVRRQTRSARPASGVVQASSEMVTPATGQDYSRRADHTVYEPMNDRTRNVPASADEPIDDRRIDSIPGGPAPGTAMALYQEGEAALKAHDRQKALQLFRQAYQRSNELDPRTARRAQELVQMLSAPPAPAAAPGPQPGEEPGKQALATQLTIEVGNQIVAARNQMNVDPLAAVKTLEETRAKVEKSTLTQGDKDVLLRRLDGALTDTKRFVADNKPRIDMDNRNREVKQQINREQQNQLDVQNKLAQLTEEFNTLVEERRFAEAELTARKAMELAPDHPISHQLVVTAKLMRANFNNLAVKDKKEDGFVSALASVDEASTPWDDRNPIGFPKNWSEISRSAHRRGREAGRKLSEREVEINKRLDTPVSVEFDNAPLAKVIETLSQYTGVNMVLDPQGTADEGVSSDTPVTLNLKSEVKLKNALSLILGPMRLTYVVKNEVLKITSERYRNGDSYTKVYHVADLVIPIPNFVGGQGMGLQGAYNNAMQSAAMTNANGGLSHPGMVSPVMLAQNRSRGGRHLDPTILAQVPGPSGARSNVPNNMPMQGGPGGMGGGSAADFDSLIDLIQNTVATDKWLDNGGVGTIEQFESNLSLVISQTQDVHDEIADLLEQLRRMQDLQVTIEVRFITLNDNFFERIGVDFDFDIRDRSDHAGQIFGRATSTAVDSTSGALPRDLGDPSRDPNSYTVGLQGATTSTSTTPLYTADLDIPFQQNTFGLAIPQFGGFDPTAGATMGFAILSQIEAFFFIQAAQADRRTNVLQAPKVTLFNGQQASIQDQSQSPFVMSVIPVVGDFAAAQQPVIVVLNEGTHLTVQAVISSDRRFVRLTIVPYFSQIGDVNTFRFVGEETTTTDSSQEGVQDTPNNSTKKATKTTSNNSGTTVQLPTFSYVTVSTTVSVPDGGTVLLGGIKRLSEGRNEAGVPILDKIPYINRLFKNVGIGRETQSLMMMVTPRIIIQEEEEEKLGIATTTP